MQYQVLWATTGIMLLPHTGGMAVQIWKDVPYTCLLLIGLCLVVKSDFNSRSAYLGFFLIGLGSSFRHDGIIVLLVDIFFIIIFRFIWLKKKNSKMNINKLSLRSMAGVCVVSLFFSLGAPFLVSANPAPSFLKVVSFSHDLAYIVETSDGKVSNNLKDFVANYSIGESLKGAGNCLNTSPMMYSNGYDFGYLSENWKDVLFMWASSLKSYSQEILFARMCSAAAFLPPIPISSMNPFLQSSDWKAEWLGWGVHPPEVGEKFGIVHRPLFPAMDRGLYWWRGLFGEFTKFVAWPGFMLTISGILIAVNRRKNPLSSATKILFAFVLSRHIVLSILGVGLIYRYGFMTHLFSICIAAALLVTSINSKNPEMERFPAR